MSSFDDALGDEDRVLEVVALQGMNATTTFWPRAPAAGVGRGSVGEHVADLTRSPGGRWASG